MPHKHIDRLFVHVGDWMALDDRVVDHVRTAAAFREFSRKTEKASRRLEKDGVAKII